MEPKRGIEPLTYALRVPLVASDQSEGQEKRLIPDHNMVFPSVIKKERRKESNSPDK